MQNVAYDDRNATRLLGTWTFIIPYLLLRVVISSILKIVIIFTKNAFVIKTYKIISHDLFYNSFIIMSTECLFSFIIISYLNLKTIEYSSFGESFGVVLSYICIVTSVACLPLMLIWALIFKKHK